MITPRSGRTFPPEGARSQVWCGEEKRTSFVGRKQLVANMTKWGRVSFWVVMHDYLLSFFFFFFTICYLIISILLGSIFSNFQKETNIGYIVYYILYRIYLYIIIIIIEIISVCIYVYIIYIIALAS